MSFYIAITLICASIISTDFISMANAEAFVDNIQFHLYTRKNPTASYILRLNNNYDLTNKLFNRKHQTIIFIHGFGEGEKSASAQGIKDAYLKCGEFNVIVVSWKKLAVLPWYLDAVENLSIVGPRVGQLIIWLEQQRAISIPQLHIIGFSLGAHVCAFISQELAKYKTRKIGRITGLDPAGPAFDKFSISNNGLNTTHADFVDIIHTNTLALGILKAIGHADFYVNYGESQPGCLFVDLVCSHSKSWKYYADSILHPYEYRTIQCKEWKPTVKSCFRNYNQFMGFAANPNVRGIFFVEVKSANSMW